MKTILILLLATLPNLSAQPNRYGLPSCRTPTHQLVTHTHYILCHATATRTTLWTAHQLTPANLTHTAQRPTHFRRDPLLTIAAATNNDYRNSGLSRGHLVPAADMSFSNEAIRDTFLLTNAVPQHQRSNAGRWAQLENEIRTLAANNEALYIFTGVLFESPDTQQIGPNQIPVPTHLFKVVLAVHGQIKSMYAAVVPNTGAPIDPLALLLTTVDEVEQRTHLDFFADLEDNEEQRLESARTLAND